LNELNYYTLLAITWRWMQFFSSTCKYHTRKRKSINNEFNTIHLQIFKYKFYYKFQLQYLY